MRRRVRPPGIRGSSPQAVLEAARDHVMDTCSETPVRECVIPCIEGGMGVVVRASEKVAFGGPESFIKSADDIADEVIRTKCLPLKGKEKKDSICASACWDAVQSAKWKLVTGLSKFVKPGKPDEAGVMGKPVRIGGRLGIIVAPHEKCKKGFERIIIKGGRNKRVHVCRLAKGYRKYEPEVHKAPYRRLREFGPGIEHRQILKREAWRRKKAERVLTDED